MTPKSITYHELMEALEERGCAICRRAEESVEGAIAAILHEQVNDAGFRERLLGSRGFCREHAWRVVHQHDILGTAILHRALLASSGSRTAPCPLCESREVAERIASETLVAHLDDERVLERLRRSDGLCNEHYERAMTSSRRSRRLAGAQRAAREALIGQLDELIRKQDYRFQEEPLGEEANVWLRAVAAVSGLELSALPRRRSRKLPPR